MNLYVWMYWEMRALIGDWQINGWTDEISTAEKSTCVLPRNRRAAHCTSGLENDWLVECSAEALLLLLSADLNRNAWSGKEPILFLYLF